MNQRFERASKLLSEKRGEWKDVVFRYLQRAHFHAAARCPKDRVPEDSSAGARVDVELGLSL